MADVWEKDLAQKALVTADDYVRVVGADNVSYKQQIKFMPSQYVVPSGTDLLAYIKTLGTGTYFVRMDNVSGFPVTGGVVYRIVKTHSVNDARASIIAIPMNATASIYTAFITSASASSISWVSQPTRAEVDALTTSTAVTVTAADQVVIDTNKSYKMGRLLFLNVKGHATADISNTTIFTISGVNINPNSFTFGIPLSNSAWTINDIGYGYVNAGSITARISNGQYFHISQVFLIQ